jgi:hypothetical protein
MATSDQTRSIGLLFLFLTIIVLVGIMLLQSKLLSRFFLTEGFDGAGRYDVIYFSRAGCPHCTAFVPEWNALGMCIKQYLAGDGRNCSVGIDLQTRMTDEYPSDVTKYNIQGVPQLIVVKPDGTHLNFNGVMTKASIVAWLNTVVPCSITC